MTFTEILKAEVQKAVVNASGAQRLADIDFEKTPVSSDGPDARSGFRLLYAYNIEKAGLVARLLEVEAALDRLDPPEPPAVGMADNE
jgi:hypothetical protein